MTLTPTPRYPVPPGQPPRLNCAGCGQCYRRDVATAPRVHVMRGPIGTPVVSWHRRCYDAAGAAEAS